MDQKRLNWSGSQGQRKVDHSPKLLTVQLQLTQARESLGIGLLVDSRQRLIVDKVAPDKPAYGKLFVGDTIVTLNGMKVMSVNDFVKALQSSQDGKHEFRVWRLKVNRFLGQEHEMLVHRQMGYDYFVAQMNIATKIHTKPFGAAVTTWRQRVIIADVQPNSFAEEYFQPLDRVLTINGTPVNTAEESAELFNESGGRLAILIERPVAPERIELYANALRADGEDNVVTERSVWCVSEAKTDVLKIGAGELERLKEEREKAQGQCPSPKPILKDDKKKQEDGGGKGQLQVKSQHQEVQIRRDLPFNKQLTPVPRRS